MNSIYIYIQGPVILSAAVTLIKAIAIAIQNDPWSSYVFFS